MQTMSISEDRFSRSSMNGDLLTIPNINLDASGEEYFAFAVA
jgi:hypothetical protein